MQPRRPLALVAAALLCVPVLTSCGFHTQLQQVYTPSAGTDYRHGNVYVLSAVIVAAQADSGTLIASFSNQSTTDATTLEGVAGGRGNSVQSGDFTPISIKPMGFVNLADGDGPITLSGSFAAGDILPLSMNFEDGSTITMDVPVVYACQAYAGLDASQGSASASPGADETATPLASAASPSAGDTEATPSSADSPSPSGSASTYTCGTSGGTGGRS